jgi:hypothetical protein
MNRERVRSILGVWAPMVIGLFIIATSINFYVTATLDASLESWRLVCSAGAFFVGGLLILSTYGRYTKAKEWRREIPTAPSGLPTPPHRDDEPNHQGDSDHEQD